MAKRILVLEDDPDQARGMVDLLEVEGYDVTLVLASDDAENTLSAGKPFDAFVFDYSVPPFNSGELIEKLGSHVFKPGKVIMITAYENQVTPRPEIRKIIVKPHWIENLIAEVKAITQ